MEEGTGTTLGQRIKAARKACGLTQAALSAPDLSASYISMLEHDKVRPSLATLRILADRLRQPLVTFLDSPPPPAEQAVVILGRADSLLRQHRFTEAAEAFDAAAPAARESGDPILPLRAALGLGQALAGLRQFDLAEPHLTRAQALAEASGQSAWIGAVANALGFLAFRARRFPQAREIFQAGVDRLRVGEGDEPETLGKLLSNLGRVYVELGLPAQAMQCLHDASALLSRAADPAHRALLLFNLGIASEQQRSYAQAQAYLEQAEALLRVQENLRLLGMVKRSLGMLQGELGHLPEAGIQLSDSLHLARQSHDDEGAAQTLVELARVRARRGDVEQARRDAAEAEALARRIGDDAEAARAAAADAEALHAAGRLGEAGDRYHAAMEMFERLGMAADLARVCRDLGRLRLAQKRYEEAARHLARACDLQPHAPLAAVVP